VEKENERDSTALSVNGNPISRWPFRCIVADPPWAYLWGKGKVGGNFSPEKHYSTMTTDEICALPVKKLRDKNCVLALWSTGPCLPDAFRVMSAWGFKFKTMLFVWVKQNPKALTIVTGPGSYTRSACEYVLLGMRGHIKRASTKPISQVILSPRRGHSRKPESMQDAIERLFPDGPRLELFARRPRDGWSVWGDRIENENSMIIKSEGGTQWAK
jgi:site-specific DNA-methyltransferase (adenine-specific)